MRQHRVRVLGIGLLVSVSLAGCVGDSTKSASDTSASIPIASVGSETVPPVVAGQPSPPPEAGEVQARSVDLAVWQLTNSSSGAFAGWAATPGVEAITGDFNGDGRTDVALVKRSAGWLSMPVAFANGDGTWRITNGDSGAFAGWAATPEVTVRTGDFNGDGRMDVALLRRTAGWATMPVAFANGDGSWRITNSDSGAFAGWATTPNVYSLTGDFNGDGRTDVALLNTAAGWTTMPVAFANGDGSWRITNRDSGAFAGWAATLGIYPLPGDFNGDGRTDVALLNRAAGWTTMPVAYANGDGSWRIINSSSGAFAGMAATDGAYPLTGDFDGDKRTDVALLRTDVALLNRAAGWTTMPVAFANADGSWRITNRDIGAFAGWAIADSGAQPLIGDFNGDGRTDVALLNRRAEWTTMPVAYANGDGSWRITNSSIGTFAGWAGTLGAFVLTGDFDGDKRTDVALINTAAGWTTMPVAFWRNSLVRQQLPKP